MDIVEYISPDRIFFLKNTKKLPAVRELIQSACKTIPNVDPEEVFQIVWEREKQVSSWIATGIAIPHGRIPDLGGFYVAIGRSKEGVEYESTDQNPVNLMILILGDSGEPDHHIMLLAEVARTIKMEQIKEMILSAGTENEIYEIILNRNRLIRESQRGLLIDISGRLLSHAVKLASELDANAIILYVDAMADIKQIAELRSPIPLILIAQREYPELREINTAHSFLRIPFPALNRTNQVSMIILLALSQGLICRNDRVVCLFGTPDPAVMDNLMVIDVSREIPIFLPAHPTSLLGDVKPPVLEKVLHLATAISLEGREGKPTGAFFVLGDYENVRQMSHQLIINPFKGYKDDEKSILDPSLEETVKEFSTLDGAFLVRGDGVIEAAGAYLRFPKAIAELPSGLGARHAAAANITAYTRALSVAVSQSTGRVSLFKSGRLIVNLDKPRA